MGFSSGWGGFAAAFLFFLASHSIPVRPPVKARLVAWFGKAGFTLAYSLLSLAALAWLIAATIRAPYVPLWDWAPWQNWITLVAMAAATELVALALGRPNPLSFGGARNAAYDPAQAGIVAWTRHPLLVALLLWSLGHIPPNGALAPVLFFGVMAAFSLLGMRMIDRRKRRRLGDESWHRLATAPRRIAPTANGLIRLGAGALAYTGVILAHAPVIGVSPLP